MRLPESTKVWETSPRVCLITQKYGSMAGGTFAEGFQSIWTFLMMTWKLCGIFLRECITLWDFVPTNMPRIILTNTHQNACTITLPTCLCFSYLRDSSTVETEQNVLMKIHPKSISSITPDGAESTFCYQPRRPAFSSTGCVTVPCRFNHPPRIFLILKA